MSDLDVDDYELGVDESRDELLGVQKDERVAIIRTSDRGGFRRCRRRWGWQSHLRGNLTTIESISPLWFGSGMHFAWEDMHGHQKYDHPKEAFVDYVRATRKAAKLSGLHLPHDWQELTQLGIGMLEYYADIWIPARDPLKTLIVDGKPQVEVNALVPIPIKSPHYDRVLYAVTLDRVVENEYGNIGIVDYKTAKRFQTHFFQTDPQISAYCWLGAQIYERPIDFFIYQQHRKDVPVPPRALATGGISTAKGQLTTHGLYRRSLINLYGAVLNAPKANVDYLNRLAEEEDENQDRFVRRDKIFRNAFQAESEGTKLLLELEEMLNPDLPLYPNPTRECGHMCSFSNACVSMDDGGDWEYELQIGFRQKDADFDHWRKYLPERT